MIFTENGGKVYSVLQVGKELVPRVGYHIKGEMGGIWFPPRRVVSSVKVMGFGNPERLFRYPGYKKIVFERGKIVLLAGYMKRCFYIELLGNGKVTLTLDDTPVWSPERSEVKEVKVGVEANGERFLENHIEIPVKGETIVKIFDEECEDFYKELERKEKIFRRKRADWSNVEGMLRASLLEAFVETESGEGIVAGFEEYPWWFSIDTHFTLPSLLKFGFQTEAKKSLENILKHGLKHEISLIGIGNPPSESEVFAIVQSIAEYTLRTGDTSFLEYLENFERKMLEILKEGNTGRGIVEVSGYEGKLLDIDTFAFAALRGIEKLEKFTGYEMPEELKVFLEGFERGFLRKWYDEGKKLFKGEIHFTQVLPLYFRLVPKDVGKNVLMRLKEIGMITDKGLKHSLFENETEGYYGNKAEKVWWLANALLKEANEAYDLPLDLSFLENLFEQDLVSFGTPPEIVGGGGCFLQSWSSLFFTGRGGL